MSRFVYRENILYCEDAILQEIAEEFGTPLYVYSRNQILENFRTAEAAFGDSNHLICYALKANSNLQILKLLAEEGAGADVVSRGELFLAQKAGFPKEKITYAGVGKRDDEIEYALRQSILCLSVESEEELQVISRIAARLGVTAPISIRINPNIDAESHPYISTGMKINKFGIDQARARAVFQLAKETPSVETVGIHVHIGSQITTVEPFLQTASFLATMVKDLRAVGVEISHIDVGGGVGINYHRAIEHELFPEEKEGGAAVATPADVVKAILPVLESTGCKVIFEPGRSIVADAGVLVTKVLFTKNTGDKKFVVVDAGMNDLIRPSLYDAYHQIVPLKLEQRAAETVDVVGPICETGDFFAIDRKLPATQRGEYLAIATVGAYGFAEASNYNARPRSAEILVNGEKCRVIREREEVEDLL